MIKTRIQGDEKRFAKNEAKLVYIDVLSVLRDFNAQCDLEFSYLTTPPP